MDELKNFEWALPQYLSDEKLNLLLANLKKYPDDLTSDKIYTKNKYQNYWMQGDGFREVTLPIYENGIYSSDITSALLISNTCDVSLENKRSFYNPSLTLIPILSLSQYQQCLLEDGHKSDAVNNHIKDIKDQKLTSFLFLPTFNNDIGECFTRFDHVFNIPLDQLNEEGKRILLKNRLFSFSNYGFYMFLFKLSIHFTRIQEKIDRD